jgi:Uma2 family endonuclease
MSTIAVTQLPRLGPGSAGVLMTPEEFDEITDYDERYRYELINGVLVVSPIPSEAEIDPNEELGYLLRRYQDDHPQGAALDATLPERYVPTRNRRRADRLIWTGLGRKPRPKTDLPTIVVEFVSKSRRDWRRDYIDKRAEYFEIGIAEYWVIDRFLRRMTVYSSLPSRSPEAVLEENETYRTDLLPGFELPLARLLETADSWIDQDDEQ